MPRSQNGLPANDRSLIATYTVPGTSTRLALRKGAVATVLLYVAAQFDKRVEDLDTPNTKGYVKDRLAIAGSDPSRVRDDWSYAERPIRGSTTTLSNHASGSAIDLNATQHPLGKRGTFTNKQVTEIHQILREVDGTVRWGGDYRTRADEMHFEIDASLAKVRGVAARLDRAAAARVTARRKAAKKKTALSRKKKAALAAAALAAAAAAVVIPATQAGGPSPKPTVTASPSPSARPIVTPTPKPTAKPKPAAKPYVLRRVLIQGASGGDVRRMQAVVGVPRAQRDGEMGPSTVRYVKRWQSRRGLTADGQFGKASAKKAGWTWTRSG